MSGSLEGDLLDDGNSIVNARNLHAVYSARPHLIFDNLFQIGSLALTLDCTGQWILVGFVDSHVGDEFCREFWVHSQPADPSQQPSDRWDLPDAGLWIQLPRGHGPTVCRAFNRDLFSAEQVGPTPIPEPSTFLLTLPVLHLIARRRRQR